MQNKIINNKDIQNLKIKNNKDIYIVLYNAAISLKEFDKIYNLSVEEKFLKNLPQNLFIIRISNHYQITLGNR